mmetsp:Transcript_23993/g.79733  ORF Transcript_23993/g.79733 Transcript_23993/m.79733 type:complete len:216 (+) Transcript_23993:317-964(+)
MNQQQGDRKARCVSRPRRGRNLGRKRIDTPMRARHIECTWREGQPSARLIVLQIVSAEFFVFGQTKCIAVNPDGARPDLEAFRWLVGRSWSNYPAAVLEIHKALRGHQTGVRECGARRAAGRRGLPEGRLAPQQGAARGRALRRALLGGAGGRHAARLDARLGRLPGHKPTVSEGAVAVDGQATAGKMPIAIETLLEPRRALKVERDRIGCSAVN